MARLTGAKPPEYSARYYPRDTLAYYWLTLTPGDGQLSDSREIFQLLNEYSVFEDWLDEIQDYFEEETGADFDADVQPWIGVDFSAALIGFDVDREEIDATATIAVRDGEAAAEFMDNWLDYMEDETGSVFDRDSSGEFEIWIAESSPQVYALSDELLVFATSEDILDDVLERVESETELSLADTNNFITARSALPERRFTSLYLNVESLVDELDGEWPDLDEWYISGLGGIDELPEWAAVSAGWVEKGLVLESVSPESVPVPYGSSGTEDPAGNLPDDTLAYIAVAFNPQLDAWRDELREYPLDGIPEISESIDDLNREISSLADELDLPDPPKLRRNSDMDEVLDLGLWWADELSGIDFESDFFDHLDGEMILAVSDFDFDRLSENPENYPIDATGMLSYRSGSMGDLSETMHDIADYIEEELELDSDNVDVGADADATIFELPETSYEPGYVLLDSYLALGTTEDALEDLASPNNRLASDREHQRAMRHMADGWELLAYVNLQLITGQIDADDVGLKRPEIRLLREVFGVATLGIYRDGDYSRARSVLTLLPE